MFWFVINAFLFIVVQETFIHTIMLKCDLNHHASFVSMLKTVLTAVSKYVLLRAICGNYNELRLIQLETN